MNKIKCDKCGNETFSLYEAEEKTEKGYSEIVVLTKCNKCDEVNTRCWV